MRRVLSIAILVFPWIPLTGQEVGDAFTQDQLFWFIRNYHPVAVQASLLDDAGNSTVRSARGAFDPELLTRYDQKFFNDEDYFKILGGGLRIPTWYGLELRTGIDQNSGVFLNPERNVPSQGLWYAGLSVTLGQGLFIDKRRATLEQASLFAQSTPAQQQKQMNDLFFKAVKQYWKWVEEWNRYEVFDEALDLAQQRFEAVRESFELGDIPAIDTLEAFIQVQNRELNRDQALLAYQNRTLELSNFLWFENNTPLEITDEIRPPSWNELVPGSGVSQDTVQQMLAEIDDVHPDLQILNFQIASMEVDKKMKREALKPTLNLNYNALSNGNEQSIGNLSSQNYKWGIEFGIPLFLRKERGELQLAKLKIQDAELGQSQKKLEIRNRIGRFYNEQFYLGQQVTLQTDAVANYSRLLDGERQKFAAGESSLFLVNSREVSLIEAQLKLIELVAKYNVALEGVAWAGGTLYEA